MSIKTPETTFLSCQTEKDSSVPGFILNSTNGHENNKNDLTNSDASEYTSLDCNFDTNKMNKSGNVLSSFLNKDDSFSFKLDSCNAQKLKNDSTCPEFQEVISLKRQDHDTNVNEELEVTVLKCWDVEKEKSSSIRTVLDNTSNEMSECMSKVHKNSEGNYTDIHNASFSQQKNENIFDSRAASKSSEGAEDSNTVCSDFNNIMETLSNKIFQKNAQFLHFVYSSPEVGVNVSSILPNVFQEELNKSNGTNISELENSFDFRSKTENTTATSGIIVNSSKSGGSADPNDILASFSENHIDVISQDLERNITEVAETTVFKYLVEGIDAPCFVPTDIIKGDTEICDSITTHENTEDGFVKIYDSTLNKQESKKVNSRSAIKKFANTAQSLDGSSHNDKFGVNFNQKEHTYSHSVSSSPEVVLNELNILSDVFNEQYIKSNELRHLKFKEPFDSKSKNEICPTASSTHKVSIYSAKRDENVDNPEPNSSSSALNFQTQNDEERFGLKFHDIEITNVSDTNFLNVRGKGNSTSSFVPIPLNNENNEIFNDIIQVHKGIGINLTEICEADILRQKEKEQEIHCCSTNKDLTDTISDKICSNFSINFEVISNERIQKEPRVLHSINSLPEVNFTESDSLSDVFKNEYNKGNEPNSSQFEKPFDSNSNFENVYTTASTYNASTNYVKSNEKINLNHTLRHFDENWDIHTYEEYLKSQNHGLNITEASETIVSNYMEKEYGTSSSVSVITKNRNNEMCDDGIKIQKNSEESFSEIYDAVFGQKENTNLFHSSAANINFIETVHNPICSNSFKIFELNSDKISQIETLSSHSAILIPEINFTESIFPSDLYDKNNEECNKSNEEDNKSSEEYNEGNEEYKKNNEMKNLEFEEPPDYKSKCEDWIAKTAAYASSINSAKSDENSDFEQILNQLNEMYDTYIESRDPLLNQPVGDIEQTSSSKNLKHSFVENPMNFESSSGNISMDNQWLSSKSNFENNVSLINANSCNESNECLNLFSTDLKGDISDIVHPTGSYFDTDGLSIPTSNPVLKEMEISNFSTPNFEFNCGKNINLEQANFAKTDGKDISAKEHGFRAEPVVTTCSSCITSKVDFHFPTDFKSKKQISSIASNQSKYLNKQTEKESQPEPTCVTSFPEHTSENHFKSSPGESETNLRVSTSTVRQSQLNMTSTGKRHSRRHYSKKSNSSKVEHHFDDLTLTGSDKGCHLKSPYVLKKPRKTSKQSDKSKKSFYQTLQNCDPSLACSSERTSGKAILQIPVIKEVNEPILQGSVNGANLLKTNFELNGKNNTTDLSTQNISEKDKQLKSSSSSSTIFKKSQSLTQEFLASFAQLQNSINCVHTVNDQNFVSNDNTFPKNSSSSQPNKRMKYSEPLSSINKTNCIYNSPETNSNPKSLKTSLSQDIESNEKNLSKKSINTDKIYPKKARVKQKSFNIDSCLDDLFCKEGHDKSNRSSTVASNIEFHHLTRDGGGHCSVHCIERKTNMELVKSLRKKDFASTLHLSKGKLIASSETNLSRSSYTHGENMDVLKNKQREVIITYEDILKCTSTFVESPTNSNFNLNDVFSNATSENTFLQLEGNETFQNNFPAISEISMSVQKHQISDAATETNNAHELCLPESGNSGIEVQLEGELVDDNNSINKRNVVSPQSEDHTMKSITEIISRNITVVREHKHFDCQFCPKKFQYKSLATRHLVTHTKELLFTCLICDRLFRRSDSLQTHIVKGHKINIKSAHQYMKCEESMYELVKVVEATDSHETVHREGSVVIRKNRQKCFHCDKTFKFATDFKKHLSTHIDDDNMERNGVPIEHNFRQIIMKPGNTEFDKNI